MNRSSSPDTRLRWTAVHGLFGFRRRRAVRRLAKLGTVDAARALATVLLVHPIGDTSVTQVAESALRDVSDQAARDAVCEVLLNYGHPLLGTLVREHGWAPSDPARQTLVLFLVGELDRCAELDFDGSLLAAAYAAAGEQLRHRIVDRARATGRVEWVEAIVGRRAHSGGRLSTLEWGTLTDTLTGARRWEELWRLALVAPPERSADILHRLDERGWRPDDADGRAAADELYQLARVARTTTGVPLNDVVRIDRGNRDEISDVAANPAGSLLATRDNRGEVRLWHLPSGEPGPLITPSVDRAGRGDAASCLAITPDGRLLATGCGDGSIRLWHLPSGQPAGVLGVRGSGKAVRQLAVTPDASLLISVEYDPRSDEGGEYAAWRLRLWRLPSGAPVARWGYCPIGTNRLVVTPDGTVLLSAGGGSVHRHGYPSMQAAASLWRLPSGEPVGGGYGVLRAVAVSPDGGLLVTEAWDLPMVRLTRLPSGEPAGTVHVADEPPSGSYGLRLSPDIGRPAPVQTYDPFQDGFRHSLAVSPDGGLLARAGKYGVGLWRLPSGEPVGWLPSWPECRPYWLHQLVFTADGRALIGNSHDVTAVWRLPSGELAGTLPENHSWVLATKSSTLLVGCKVADPGLWVRRYRTPRVAAVAGTPIPDVGMPEADELRRPDDHPADRALAELTAALARHYHASDIELAPETTHRTDIELSD